jgi:NADP-dependent 3-hydroxy acid dehydrogenase YdfG
MSARGPRQAGTPDATGDAPLLGEVAFVTGAASGSGGAAALACARAGADVPVADRR